MLKVSVGFCGTNRKLLSEENLDCLVQWQTTATATYYALRLNNHLPVYKFPFAGSGRRSSVIRQTEVFPLDVYTNVPNLTPADKRP